jgi:hypothetical protein
MGARKLLARVTLYFRQEAGNGQVKELLYRIRAFDRSMMDGYVSREGISGRKTARFLASGPLVGLRGIILSTSCPNLGGNCLTEKVPFDFLRKVSNRLRSCSVYSVIERSLRRSLG